MRAVSADHYRGHVATTYEARRAHKPPWEAEQTAVREFVRLGPVLDVPVGTGRYLGIYQDLGLQATGCDLSPDMLAVAAAKGFPAELIQGSIFTLPFPDAHFGTAVCTRLLNWLQPGEMARAIAELVRVAREVVLSIRLGEPKQWTTYTHGRETFLAATAGDWLDAERELREEGPQGSYRMIRLRRPTFGDILAQFADRKPTGLDTVLRLSREWSVRYQLLPVEYAQCPVRAEWWTPAELARVMRIAAAVEPRVVSDGQPNLSRAPRHEGGPLTFLDFGADRWGIIDGRHRAHRFMQATTGRYPVLVLGCSSS